MPASWTMTIDQNTDWAAQDFQQMFRDAVFERFLADETYTTPPISATVSVSDDISSAAYISLLQQVFEPATWVRKTGSLSADAKTYSVGHTFASLAFDAGLHADPVTLPVARRLRRKKPREITSIGDTVDTDGNTIANGHKALMKSSGVSGQVFSRVAGAWVSVPTDTNEADTLDSWLGRPNNCPGGSCQVGDYIGPWIWNELRAICNEKVRRFAKFTWVRNDWNGSATGIEYTYPYQDQAWTTAEAESNFNASLTTTNSGGFVTAYLPRLEVAGYSEGSNSTFALPSWLAILYRSQMVITAAGPTAMAGKARRYHYLVTRVEYATNGTDPGARGAFAAGNYSSDTFGDPVGVEQVDGSVYEWTSAASSGNDTQTFGDSSPPDHPPYIYAPTNDFAAIKGYVALSFLNSVQAASFTGSTAPQTFMVVVDWNVAGGFTYY